MSSANKIKSPEQATSIVKGWKSESESIVFTNGCFDLVHLGHVDYLEKAANLGQRLVVGLNSDASVRRLKGQDRPITDVISRSRILAALGFVDLVVIFDEDTPAKLIGELLPDILVKGDDYLAEDIIGADIVIENGGKVETIPLIEGYSTRKIIKKIKGQK